MIHALKFQHLLLATALTGLTLLSWFFTQRINRHDLYQHRDIIKKSLQIDQLLFILFLVQLISGTFLIIPRHHTWSTPWIQAAITLVVLILMQLGFVGYQKWRCLKNTSKKKHLPCWPYISILMAIGLLIHDAVTKHTVLGP